VKWVILGLVIAATAGCTTHYYRTQDEVVSLFLKKNAHEVYFASSLDQFILHPTREKRTGLWRIEVPGGRAFRYFYLVDGAVYTPDCQFKELDDFGMQNCIFMPPMSTDVAPSRVKLK